MRKVIDLQMELWKKDIDNIEFDLQSRDEIPKLLMGLQHIYSTAPIREKIFKLLKPILFSTYQPCRISNSPGKDARTLIGTNFVGGRWLRYSISAAGVSVCLAMISCTAGAHILP